MRFRKWLPLLLILAMLAPMAYPLQTEAAVKINTKNATIVKGMYKTLKITGTSKKVKWTSSKKSVATVSSKGKVTAKKPGTCTIKAKVGKKTYTCKITVISTSRVYKKVFNYVTKRYSSARAWDARVSGRYYYIYFFKPQGDGAVGLDVKVDLLTGWVYFGSGRAEFFSKLPKKVRLWK